MRKPDSTTLLKWLKPEPISPEQEKGLALLQPGEYEIYNERLNTYLDEAREVFTRTGMSSMLRSGDLIVGIYTPDGDMPTASMGTYLHSVSGTLIVKYIAKNWVNNPTVGVKDGDTFYANEALFGGIHNCDQIAVMPVFNDGELIAWVAAAVHQCETGGVDPGGYTIIAKSRCWEGMRLTPIKIGSDFKLHEDMIEMMENMVTRTPRMQNTDVRARFTACDRLRRRIQDLAQEKDNTWLQGLFRRLIIEAEKAARKKISGWNDGTFRTVSLIDGTGAEISMLRVFCTLTKKGDQLTFDLTGTSPEHDAGSMQATPHIVAAHIAVYLFAHAFWDVPVSNGAYAPLEFRVPEGCFYNPAPMGALGDAPPACLPVFNFSYTLFGKMLFDSPEKWLITAANADCSAAVVAGTNQWGVPVADLLTYCFNTCGQGARYDKDGVDAYGFNYCHIGKGADAEELEILFPLLTLFQSHLKDSAGMGKYRGGCGVGNANVIHGVPWFTEQAVCPGGRVPCGSPLFGGYPAHKRVWIRIRNTNIWEKMKRGDKDIPKNLQELLTERTVKGKYEIEDYLHSAQIVENGDIFVDFSMGAGGYGDVLERNPDMVMEDLRKEIISHRTAQKVCKVVYDPDNFDVDYQKTEELRQQERETRKKQGKSYDEFLKGWSQKKPSEQALKYYGSWPDAKKVRDVIRI